MKNLFLAASVYVAAASAMSIAASIPMGRGEVSLSASASGTYDSNVEGRRGADDDYYGTFSPRASYIRRAGKIEVDANLSLSIFRYLDHKEFNSENIAADASVHLSPKVSPNFSGSFNIGYTESYAVDLDVNGRVKANTTSISVQTGLVTGPRTQLSFTAGYTNSDRIGASDQESFNGGASFNYNGFLDGTNLGLSYGYAQAESSGANIYGVGLDQKSHSFSASLSRGIYRDVTGRVGYGYRWLSRSAAETVAGSRNQNGSFITAGIDGPFLPRGLFPKIKSHASFSYEDAQTPGINDVGGKQITGDIGLTWEARQSTSVSLATSRSQRLSSTDLTVVSSNVHASITQQLRYNLSGTAGVTYNWESYRGLSRKDKIFSFTSGVDYSFGRSWSTSASYIYTSTSSTQTISDFSKHIATITVAHTF
ncbi:MAG: outer membrane beta-barrel protein [Opitutaceae bacterium]